jgi:hypothetical protein
MSEIRLDSRWSGRFYDAHDVRHPNHGSYLYEKENGMCCLGIVCHDLYDFQTYEMNQKTMPYSLLHANRDNASFMAFLAKLSVKINRRTLPNLIGWAASDAVFPPDSARTIEGLGVILARINDSDELTPHQKAEQSASCSENT